jgi:hypothetical protein
MEQKHRKLPQLDALITFTKKICAAVQGHIGVWQEIDAILRTQLKTCQIYGR